MATVALSKLLRRPIKFVADRIESFVTDIHARDHRVKAKIGVKNDGSITAWEIDDLTGIGPYSVYPRTSGIEANQIVNLTGGPYTCPNYRARARVVFQNKNVMCQYRAVGHPIATAVTEGLVELAAAQIGMDPLEIRRRNLIADDAHPSSGPSGIKFEALSHHECLAHLDAMMNYAGLRAEQKRLRAQRIHRGIGFASFVEVTNPSAAFYGIGGAKISAQDGVTIRLDAQGAGPRRRSGHRAGRGVVLRRADRARARHHRRHRQHALWRRHLGLARGRHRRGSGLAGRQGAARQRARLRRLDPAGQARRPRHPQWRYCRLRHRHRAPAAA
jgi:carbon-monoxide dehydrogenase large subunit